MTVQNIKDKSFTRITLALDIIGKLKEGQYAGYHELGIVKHQINLADDIEIAPSEKMELICDHEDVPIDESNLCWKAADLVKKKFGINENVQIKIKKHIPVQGGLAGGSTNAAKVIEMLNTFWSLDMSQKEMMDIGRQVGMDVPFYFMGGTGFDTETTGVLDNINTNMQMNFILAIPDFGISTKEAYQGIDYTLVGKNTMKTESLINALKRNDIDGVAQNMHNDFEIHLFQKHPELTEIKDRLKNAGCLNSVLSASGSTIIGLIKEGMHDEVIGSLEGEKLKYRLIKAESI